MNIANSAADDAIVPRYATDVVPLGETMALIKAEAPGPLAHVASVSLGMGGSGDARSTRRATSTTIDV